MRQFLPRSHGGTMTAFAQLDNIDDYYSHVGRWSKYIFQFTRRFFWVTELTRNVINRAGKQLNLRAQRLNSRNQNFGNSFIDFLYSQPMHQRQKQTENERAIQKSQFVRTYGFFVDCVWRMSDKT